MHTIIILVAIALFLPLVIVEVRKSIQAARAYKAGIAGRNEADAKFAVAMASQTVARQSRNFVRYVSRDGRALVAEIVNWLGDGQVSLRRRGHRHAACFTRPMDAVFPR